MARIYLAASYPRRVELHKYRQDLYDSGHEVTSRWLNGNHSIDEWGRPISDDNGARSCTKADAPFRRQDFINDDLSDILAADIFVLFAQYRDDFRGSGGRLVELGYALAGHKVVVVVGRRENLFFWDLEIQRVDTWPEALEHIEEWE